MANNSTNKIYEPEFVQKFIEDLQKQGISAVKPSRSNQSDYADCEIILNNKHIQIEAKMLRDSRNRSGQVHMLFGKLLADRNRKKLLPTNAERSVLGILIPESSFECFEKLWNKYKLEDMEIFCREYQLNYLILFNENTDDISFYKLPQLKRVKKL